MIPSGVVVKHGRYYRLLRQGARTRWIGLTRVSEGPAALQAMLDLQELQETAKTVGDLTGLRLSDLMRLRRDWLSDVKSSIRLPACDAFLVAGC